MNSKKMNTFMAECMCACTLFRSFFPQLFLVLLSVMSPSFNLSPSLNSSVCLSFFTALTYFLTFRLHSPYRLCSHYHHRNPCVVCPLHFFSQGCMPSMKSKSACVRVCALELCRGCRQKHSWPNALTDSRRAIES
ncbi:hypothetical protein F5H01DRAFT_358044 [Linnemannia elongata]|nr:hypothetical protein F5H01DRAFT_358044 [Linnemannia elongata]